MKLKIADRTLTTEFLTPEQEPQIAEIGVSEAERSYRLTKLRSCNLDPFEQEILSMLERPIVLTPIELEYLTQIESRYGIVEIERC